MVGSVTSRIDVPLNSACPVIVFIGFGTSVSAAVMADVGDVAVTLLRDGRLICAARLQVVLSDQPHVLGFGRRTDFLLLRQCRRMACKRPSKRARSDQRNLQTPPHPRPPWIFAAFMCDNLAQATRPSMGRKPIVDSEAAFAVELVCSHKQRARIALGHRAAALSILSAPICAAASGIFASRKSKIAQPAGNTEPPAACLPTLRRDRATQRLGKPRRWHRHLRQD